MELPRFEGELKQTRGGQAPHGAPCGRVHEFCGEGVGFGRARGFGRQFFVTRVENDEHMRPPVGAAALFDEQGLFAQTLDEFPDECLLRRSQPRSAARGLAHHRLHALDESAAPGRHFQRRNVAGAVEHAIGQGLLLTDEVKNAVLDAAFRDEIDDRYGAALVLAPSSGDALFELRRIPG